MLLELQCKANTIIQKNSFTSSLLNTSMHVDTQFYKKFGNTKAGKSYIVPRKRGTIVLFDSRTQHRVLKVTKGTRKSIVGWTVGPRWK